MSYTIFTSNPTALIPQPGRAVNTFASGLVRVDQTYLGLTSQAATHRTTLAIGNNMPDGNSSPCIDGLKIFPEVQERRREDGFTEYIVSAYGRANSTGSKTRSKQLGEFTTRYQAIETRPPLQDPLSGYHTQQYAAISDLLIWRFVMPVGAVPNVEISDTLTVYRTSGATSFLLSEIFNRTAYNTEHPAIPPTDSLALGQNKRITLAENTNYGAFDEWTVAWVATPPETLDFGAYFRVFSPTASTTQETVDLKYLYTTPIGATNFNHGWAHEVVISQIQNLQTTQNSWNSSTPRVNIPAGTATTTYRGGTLTWTAGTRNITYTPPPVVRPSGPGSGSYTSLGFEWVSIPTAPFWEFQTTYEVFEITLRNERNMTGTYSAILTFTDADYPA